MSARSPPPHFGFLDSLRGIAILGVVLVHSAIITAQHGATFRLAFTGQRGVQLFYEVSAFTLFLSLDSRKAEHRPLVNFFIRRFFRIAPLFYLAMVANYVLSVYAPYKNFFANSGMSGLVMGIFFLHGWRPDTIVKVVIGGWSIAVEMSFYLLVPLLHRFLRTIQRTLVFFVASAIVLGAMSRFLALRAGAASLEQYFSFLWFPVEFPVFLLGILAYLMWRQCGDAAHSKDISLVLLFGSAMTYCACLPFTDQKLYFSSFLFVPLILALAMHPWPLLVNSFTRYLGKISYSIYLVHFFILALVDWLLSISGPLVSRYVMGHATGCLFVFLLVLGLSLPACALTWKFVEQPGILLGRRLIRRYGNN